MDIKDAIVELETNIDLPFGFTVSDETSQLAIQALETLERLQEMVQTLETNLSKDKITVIDWSNDYEKYKYDIYCKTLAHLKDYVLLPMKTNKEKYEGKIVDIFNPYGCRKLDVIYVKEVIDGHYLHGISKVSGVETIFDLNDGIIVKFK